MRRVVVFALLLAPAACKRTGSTTAHAEQPAVTTPAVARTDRLTVEMMVDLREVGDVAVAPDGRRVAYVVRVPPSPEDGPAGATSQIWIAPTRGGEARRFTAEGVSSFSPQWSPDGRTLAFLSTRKGTPNRQVWGMPPDGGEPVALTKSDADIEHFEWSPDGKQIAYSAEREKTDKERADEEAGRDWITADVHGTWSQLSVVPVAGGEAKAITPRDRDVIAFRWSPDGSRLAVRAADRPDIDGEMMYSRLYTVPAEGGALKALAETEGKLGELEWSPDGKQIAYLGAEDIHDPTAGVLWVVPAAGGAPRALTRAYLGTGEDLRWISKDTIAMLAHQGTKTPIVRVTLDGDFSPMLSGPTICRGFDIAADDRTVACAGELPTHPRELHVGDLRKGGLRRLTRLNPEIDKVVLGERRIMKWKAADGMEIEGVVTLPVEYEAGKRYPLAILPHGGPEGISLDGWNTRAGYPVQMFATHGYVVLEPNYRGSSGRGVDYGKADHLDLGGKEFEDVLAGIDALAAEGLVDPQRVGMGGWSYGGYFSGLAATMHSSRFKAAVVAAAITDWISFTGTSEIEHENSLVHWKMWPWDDFQRTWERSPVAHVKSSKTPTLIVHGASDTRVPPEQATELYRALKHKKVETEIVYYPREGHGLRERAHQIDFATRFLAWFDAHV
jgi:dipeptidyl aminopeptidase/acylaminoacyl peptidase